MRSLTFLSCLFLSMILLTAPVMAQDEGDELSLDIPSGYVVIISLFASDQIGQMGVTYTLGLIQNTNTILTAQRAVKAHRKGALPDTGYRIIILTAGNEVLSMDDPDKCSEYYPNSQWIKIAIEDPPLAVELPPPKLDYDYKPTTGDRLNGILLTSDDSAESEEPLSIQIVGFTLLSREEATGYYPILIESLPPSEVYSGFALKDNRIVGLILKRNDGIMFFMPLEFVLHGPLLGPFFYFRK